MKKFWAVRTIQKGWATYKEAILEKLREGEGSGKAGEGDITAAKAAAGNTKHRAGMLAGALLFGRKSSGKRGNSSTRSLDATTSFSREISSQRATQLENFQPKRSSKVLSTFKERGPSVRPYIFRGGNPRVKTKVVVL